MKKLMILMLLFSFATVTLAPVEFAEAKKAKKTRHIASKGKAKKAKKHKH